MPEELSKEIGVPFDKCHRKGEPRGKNHLNGAWWEQHKRYWDESWWTLYEQADSTYANAYNDLPIALDRLLTRVEPGWYAFARLAAGGLGELAIVITSDGYPGMGLSSALLERIARLGVNVDFDLYTDPECKRLHAD